MSATERDFQAASLYRMFRGMGHDEATALHMARGRDYASERLFCEAVDRAEAELLSIDRVSAFEAALIGMDISESEARSQALEHAWGLVEEARAESVVDEFSDESMQKLIEAKPDWDPAQDGWVLDESGTSRVWRRRRAGGSSSSTQSKGPSMRGRSQFVGSPPRLVHHGEIREPAEPGSGNVKESMVESFRALGLSEDAARIAAEGR